MAPKLPTELELLETIYKSNYERFLDYSDNKTRSSKIWVPLNIDDIAKEFNLDPDIVFGRLYYHLNEKYSHQGSDGSKFEFFALRVGADTHCVNFPFMSSILASLKDDQTKFQVTTAIAGISLIISMVSVLIATLT